MRRLFLFFAVTVASCSFARLAAAQTDHSLSVSRHSTVSASSAQVDAMFASATTILRIDDDFAPGTQDVGCDVRLSRAGGVALFTDPTLPAAVTTATDRDALFAQPFNVMLVTSIGYCDRAASFAGCAPSNRRRIIMIHPYAHSGPVVAHEFGHTTGLGHRASLRALMSGAPLDGASNFVTQAECQSFVRGAATAMIAKHGDDPARTREPIDDLVRRGFVDRVPYRLISGYSAEEALSLVRLLDQPTRRQDWPNVMTVLGAAGDERAIERVMAYLRGPRPAGVDSATDERTRIAAIYALAYAVNRTGSPKALAMLEAVALEGAPSKAAGRAINTGRLQTYRNIGLWGLALSGRPQGGDALRAALAERRGLQGAFVSELQATHQFVSRRGVEGLAAYYEGEEPLIGR